MTLRSRLVLFGLSLALLLGLGYILTGSFGFVVSDFWFVSGFFLLILLSLIDQPHFSKDAHIFLNGVTAGLSLILVPAADRNAVWVLLAAWAGYLAVSSYILMLVRSRELRSERGIVRLLSRTNREIGRPEAIFSALFLWGAVLQFGQNPGELSALFVYWAAYMILNLPGVSLAVGAALDGLQRPVEVSSGRVERVVSPGVIEATLTVPTSDSMIGRTAELRVGKAAVVGKAVVLDDRVVAGSRRGRLGVVSTSGDWHLVADEASTTEVWISSGADSDDHAVSVVDAGSEIGKLVIQVPPGTHMQAGEILWTSRDGADPRIR
jgi:hypothetical protein